MSKTIKFIQYNIWESKQVSKVEEFLRAQDADIITLQEVTCGQLFQDDDKDAFMRLRKNLKLNGVYAPITLKKENGLQGNAILSRHPITSHEITFLSSQLSSEDEYKGEITKEPRAVLKAEINFDGVSLKVFTTHLTFTPYFKPSEFQLFQAKNLMNVLKREKDGPLIFAGDLNAKRESEIIDLLEKDFTNVLLDKNLLTFAKHPFSFEGFEVNKLEYLLDYIFVNDQVRPIQVNTIDVDASDHLPVIASLELQV